MGRFQLIAFCMVLITLVGCGPSIGTSEVSGGGTDPGTEHEELDHSISGFSLSAVIEALEDEDAGVRKQAASVLSAVGPEAADAVPALIEALDDESYDVRFQVVMALGAIGPAAADAVPGIVDVLRNTNQDGYNLALRWAAAYTLRDIGEPAVPAMLDLMVTGSSYERYCAVWILAHMAEPPGEQALTLLESALTDERSSTRKWAAVALGNMGSMAATALQALEIALEDKESEVQEAAEAAILTITGEGHLDEGG